MYKSWGCNRVYNRLGCIGVDNSTGYIRYKKIDIELVCIKAEVLIGYSYMC